MKMLALLCLRLLAASPLLAQSPTPAPAQVMILGTYHFGNPGLDLHNMKAENVLTPERQKELDDLAARLAKFQPTRIAIEAVSERPDYCSRKYTEFTPEKLTSNPEERVQITYRLAHRLGQKNIYGIDEASDTIDYFPFEKVEASAKAHEQAALLAHLQEKVEKKVKAVETAQKSTPIRLLLAQMNEPTAVRADHDEFYYGLLALGNQKEQPGADLNAAWYLRNAKIFAKLTQIARPGDRILLVFGAGHSFWLRHFVENTPGYTVAEPNPYLR
ncbi:MAG: DUF5694 domain-containing protein [Chthoniobacterales bacterium]